MSNIFKPLNNNMSYNSHFKSNNYSSNKSTYSNMFIDPKVEKEIQLNQQQLLEKKKNELAIKHAFNESNFSESLIKNTKDTNKETSQIKPLSFLEKAKLGAEKKELVKKVEPLKIQAPIINIKQKQINPFFKAVVNALVDLHEREEIKERNRLGDDRYEEKYGINDENYIDYFDMLDELAEPDSDYDEDSDSE